MGRVKLIYQIKPSNIDNLEVTPPVSKLAFLVAPFGLKIQ